jgi:hypothetical protein
MKYFFSIIVVFAISCSHRDVHEKHLVKGDCSSEFEKVDLPAHQKIINTTSQVTGTTFSVALSTVGFATDAVFVVLTNPITKYTLCMAIMSEGSNPSSYHACSDLAGTETYLPKMGDGILNNTKSWRCPELDHISKGLRQVASCYVKKSDNENALNQLLAVKKSHDFYKCLSPKEKQAILNQINSIEMRSKKK